MSKIYMVISTLITVFIGSAHGETKLSQLEGIKPYTPSRIEWLAVELNAGGRIELTQETGYSLDFVPIENDNTILIYVRYLPNVNRVIMNMAIDTARKVIRIKAKSRGWDRWLKIREDIKLGDGGK